MGMQIGPSTPRCFKSSKAKHGPIVIWIRYAELSEDILLQRNWLSSGFHEYPDESQKPSLNATKPTNREIDIIRCQVYSS